MAKKILIACGTGICTSTMAANKLKTELEKRGKLSQVTINQCKVAEVVSKANDYDLIVATTQVSGQISIPVVMGVAFLTGVGMGKVVDEIIEKLNI
ncbi:PTS system galactitol-specific IIB component [Anaerosolibacter carboniphilus]|uniref:PTS system galactitol-specific IIB component n=1 Tax=Anaerosolibacter carboniphilus TaxID=1417629 RepID=A0A841L519_9FIRM|nr:PTS sugar transporter subunit IIB [Anaerosolibacter carboniphilus]MBB6217415.1 PTS system galactitol-specific IIB component [Anaerosolibacter carboniphilus]